MCTNKWVIQSEIATQGVICRVTHSSVRLWKGSVGRKVHIIRTKKSSVSRQQRARDRFSTPNQWQQWPLCQLVPHQFEKVKSAPGRRCLAWSHFRRSAGLWPNLQAEQPALPAERPALPHISLPSRWGQVREPLGRGASSSRAAPFKPLGSRGVDPNWL